jgi:hypothetical protein
MISKSDKGTTRKENYRSLSLMNTKEKLFNKIVASLNSAA